MKIKKLMLYNFGVYAGENTFLFEGSKPIVLIGGMNGRGKTTFLEAVLLALYGSNSNAYLESGQKSYAKYLKAFINRNAKNNSCGVELEFEIDYGVNETYVVERKWYSNNRNVTEDIKVYKDGEYNKFLTDNWAMFVENILPSALSSFFFFDGEKIAELAVDSTNTQLKKSIRSMLGLSVLDTLNNDIKRNLKRISKNSKLSKNEKELNKLREQKEIAINELDMIDKKIDVLQQQIVKHNKKLEQLQHQYIAKGGEAVEKYQETYQKREQLKIKHNAVESDLYDLVASELPLLLVRDLITDIKLQANDEHDDMIMRQAILQLDSLYKEFIDSYSGNISAGAEFVKFVKQQANESEKSIYTLSDQALFQINHLVESGFIEAKSEAKTILSSIESLTKHISEIDSYLSLDINEHELKEIYQMIKEIEQTIINKKVKLNELTNLRSEVNSKVMTTTSEFSKYVESYLTNVELNDSRERIIKYSNMALEILEKYSFQLQRRKTDILANTITNCYIKLANKKNLIHKIIMDSETLDLQYLSEEGSVVPKDSLSAGEKQLMVIAILWSLAICSKRKLPVIIDTPLSRLDSYHRTSLIKTYFPNAGEQTIILSTDSEINQSYYDLMKENVGDEFTLYYNEQTQSTTIQNGYWIGEEL